MLRTALYLVVPFRRSRLPFNRSVARDLAPMLYERHHTDEERGHHGRREPLYRPKNHAAVLEIPKGEDHEGQDRSDPCHGGRDDVSRMPLPCFSERVTDDASGDDDPILAALVDLDSIIFDFKWVDGPNLPPEFLDQGLGALLEFRQVTMDQRKVAKPSATRVTINRP
jgi:hypothetical protein